VTFALVVEHCLIYLNDFTGPPALLVLKSKDSCKEINFVINFFIAACDIPKFCAIFVVGILDNHNINIFKICTNDKFIYLKNESSFTDVLLLLKRHNEYIHI
ncbi:hypothetical protein H311_00521, partial [Anncaliia algerae PRA109]